MLDWNDIDFSQVIPSPFIALAMLATSSGDGNNASAPPNNATLQSLPVELLIELSNSMDPADRVSTAFALPDLFMNPNRFHVFREDAFHQLSIPTWIEVPGAEEQARQPLLLHAIANNFISLDQIRLLLDLYEEVADAQHVGPGVFLNSAFPYNRPDPQPGSPRRVRRSVPSPLAVAIRHQRIDVFRYLLRERGANINQPIPRYLVPRAGDLFRYTLLLTAEKDDEDRNERFEDIILDLIPYFPTLSAYDPFLYVIMPTMFMVLDHGRQRVALEILRRAENANEVDPTRIRRRQNLQNRMLERILDRRRSMPQVIRYLLEHGARFTETDLVDEFPSLTLAALQNLNREDALVAFAHEIRTASRTLASSLAAVTRFADSDATLHSAQPFIEVLHELNSHEHLEDLLVNSMLQGQDTIQTRNLLLDRVRSMDNIALRYAIFLRDRTTMAFLIRRLIESGESIDQGLPPDSRHSAPPPPAARSGFWFETPLTFALSQRNYHAAAELLSFGADPSRVPANIRHRVRVTRDRINSGVIANIVTFVYRGHPLPDGTWPTQAETAETMDYLFTRMLDDPAHPLPNYSRPRRNQAYPVDDPHNDSDVEDFLLTYGDM
ncbi:hypothetical protein F5Y12DRAFT_762859 [Xylaria sp. FL1777]|nr:hypothetical protein F5Y12DRAFT_762859 [Xylaria sp. FL1777]